jgi:hypothetical protein
MLPYRRYSLLSPKMNYFSNLSQQVVLLPVLAGAFLVQYFQPFVKFVSPLMPPMAVATAAMLSGNAIAQSSSSILMSSGKVILASCLLHASGFFFGYILARMLRLDVTSSRTISIEVGMQVKLVFYKYRIIDYTFIQFDISLRLFSPLLDIVELGSWCCSSYQALWRSSNNSTFCCFKRVSLDLWQYLGSNLEVLCVCSC